MDLLLKRRMMMLSSEKVFAFTVNSSGKKVAFSPGNLYWDGSKFAFEEHQYDRPITWNASHIGHFYWSKSAEVARAETWNDPSFSSEDKLFAADGGAIAGYTVLSVAEYQYLIDNAYVKYATIDGVLCAIFKPDDFSENIVDSYTAETWSIIEKTTGLVAFPLTGSRSGTSMSSTTQTGGYWTISATYDPSYKIAPSLYLNPYYERTPISMSSAGTVGAGKGIRLVKVL